MTPTKSVFGSTYVQEEGQPDRPAIVLLHGVGLAHRMWTPQIDALAGRYHVLAPDLPGFGESRGPFTLEAATQSVASLVRERCAGSAHICGLSLGAMVAVQLALAEPALVRSLILSAGQVRPNPLLMGVQRLILRAIPEERLLASLIGFVPEGDDALMAAAREDARRVGKPGLLAAMREAAKLNVRSRLPDIQAPALVVCGSRDRWNLRAARELAEYLPHAQLRIIPDAGHVWNLEMPDLFAQTVLEFVDQVDMTADQSSASPSL